ncbi:terpene synthase family protein [Streptomyces monomycini]|uniref:terpene synthase family protein n=1 Tax=Streptomyces monomycini TaxID=371720 RepID=UPI0004ABC290|nr:hypothetical protein [Streptomyces monomycini]
MPRNIPLAMPLPHQPLPSGLEQVREAHVEWLHRHGLLPTEQSTERYLRSAVADIAAYGDPNSEDLLLSFHVCGWLFLYDDFMDAPTGPAPGHAETVTAELTSMLYRASTPSTPLTSAFADLWRRLCAGMSESWRLRMAWIWQEVYAGMLAETVNRRLDVTLSYHEHLRVRDMSIGTTLVAAVAERTGGYEVPVSIWPAAYLSTLRHHVTRHMLLTNDIFSLEKESARADANLVSLAMRERHQTREQALQALKEAADRHIQQLHTRSAAVNDFCDRLHLPQSARQAVTRHVEALRAWARGAYDWQCTTARYGPEEAACSAPDQPGYLSPSQP